MDKEDCIQVLLSTLQKPQWKSGNSVTDWDLKCVLQRAGLLLSPEQMAALLADVKRRGLISGRDRRVDSKIVAMWGIRVTTAGEEWLAHRMAAGIRLRHSDSPPADDSWESREPESPTSPALHEPVEASLS
ncbi:MAG: hypothetical protein ACM3US_09105 [Sphingomonadaceae bacterium]